MRAKGQRKDFVFYSGVVGLHSKAVAKWEQSNQDRVAEITELRKVIEKAEEEIDKTNGSATAHRWNNLDVRHGARTEKVQYCVHCYMLKGLGRSNRWKHAKVGPAKWLNPEDIVPTCVQGRFPETCRRAWQSIFRRTYKGAKAARVKDRTLWQRIHTVYNAKWHPDAKPINAAQRLSKSALSKFGSVRGSARSSF